MLLLVHERIAKALQADGFEGMTLTPVRESAAN